MSDIVERLRQQKATISKCRRTYYVDGAVALEAAAEIERLREERRWVPVGERLPKDNDLVLTVGKGGCIVIGEMTKSCGWQSIHCDNETGEPWISDPGDVTHWMPLQAPPEEGK
jgi:hypothetical protein